MLVPTYTVAYVSGAMIYTMPMLAVCTLITANLFDSKETENRVCVYSDGNGSTLKTERYEQGSGYKNGRIAIFSTKIHEAQVEEARVKNEDL